MLSAWEAIQQRRSIRKFAPDDVPEEIIDQLIESARLAPSGSNRQPWRFLIVRDAETRKKLREICLAQKFMEEAPVSIVCLGDLDSYAPSAVKQRRQEMEESGVTATLSGKFAEPEFRDMIDAHVTPREQLLLNVTANTYIAIEHIVIMAAAMGLGTCWVGGFDRQGINQLFNLPANLIPVAVLPVGYPAGKIPPSRPRLSTGQIVIET